MICRKAGADESVALQGVLVTALPDCFTTGSITHLVDHTQDIANLVVNTLLDVGAHCVGVIGMGVMEDWKVPMVVLLISLLTNMLSSARHN